MEVDEWSDQISDIYPHWMAAQAHLNIALTEVEKCHNHFINAPIPARLDCSREIVVTYNSQTITNIAQFKI